MNDYPENRAAREYPVEFDREMKATRRHGEALAKKHPKLTKFLNRELATIVSLKLTPERALDRLRVLADTLAKKIAPFAACRQGCGACCNIAVQISGVEARALGEAIGRPVKDARHLSIMQTASLDKRGIEDRWFGVPCPFLADGQCSVYADRPLACRLHFNLGETPFFCGTNIEPSHSFVPNYNLNDFWNACAMILFASDFADIRDYFGSAHE